MTSWTIPAGWFAMLSQPDAIMAYPPPPRHRPFGAPVDASGHMVQPQRLVAILRSSLRATPGRG